MMLSNHKAAVGRKLWYWSPDTAAQATSCLDDKVPFDATVVFVDKNQLVNVSFFDHEGSAHTDLEVEVHDPDVENDSHNSVGEAYCTWMPYQKQQMDKVEAELKAVP
jgi:hypothetical protein